MSEQIIRYGQYVVITSAAHMPNNCWGRYCNVAVMKTATCETEVKAIRETVNYWPVKEWPRRNVGGERSAYAVALREAEALARKLFLGK